MTRSGKVIDLRKGGSSSRGQQPLFQVRTWHEPESPKKRTPLRVRRLKMRAIALFVVFIIGAGLVWGVAWASYLPQFSITSIAVSGAQDIPQSSIKNYVESILHDGSRSLFSRSNVLLYPRKGIEQAVQDSFPRIKSARVSRESLLATAINVKVEERAAYAEWCADTQCYVIDDGGFVFGEVGSTTSFILSTLYVFRGGIASSTDPIGESFAPAHFPGILVLLKLLGQAGFNPLGGSIDNDEDLIIPFKEGFSLKVSFGQDADTLTNNLKLVLESDPLKGREHLLEYIDLRFDNRVYYKLRGETEIANTSE